MSQFKIEKCFADERKLIMKSLDDYNLLLVPATLKEMWIPFEYIVKNETNEVIGGLLSVLGYWHGLEIKTLWVREDHRKKRIGTELLIRAEKDAKEKGAVISFLDTFDFHAKDFYLKNGYVIFGELKNFPINHTRYYFSKQLK